MDRLLCMAVFRRVVDAGSSARAARDLGMSPEMPRSGPAGTISHRVAHACAYDLGALSAPPLAVAESPDVCRLPG